MTIIDLITEEHRNYLASAKTRRDWVRYIAEVERLRTRCEVAEPTLAVPAAA
jgi:hypothetical protein